MKRILNILILSFISSFGFCQTLNDYLKIAAENNSGLKASFSSYMASMEKAIQVGTLPEPQLAFAYFISPVETRVGSQRAKLALTQKFPWFGLLDAKEDVEIEKAKIKYEAFEQQKSKLFFDVKSLYYDIYFVKRSIEVSNKNLKILHNFQELALSKIEAGKSSVIDELRVEMKINELMNQLAYLEDLRIYNQIKFNLFLNTEINNNIAISDSLPLDEMNLEFDNYKDSITLNNHKLKQLEHRIITWKKQETVSDLSRKPNFSIGIDYTFIGKSDNPMIDASENGRDAILFPKIMLSIPIYRKKYNAAVKEVVLNMESDQFKKEDIINQLTGLMEKGFKDLRDAERRMNLFNKQTNLASKTLEILQTTYIVEGTDFEEMLRIEQTLLKYKIELAKAYTDKNVAIAFIDFLSGK